MTYKRKPPYTPQEDALIIAGTITDDALAKMLGRSEVAIRVRRQTVRDRDRQGDVKPRGWVPTLEEIEERKKLVWEMRRKRMEQVQHDAS